VQQQVVPLSYGSDMQPPSPQAAVPPPPPQDTPPPDNTDASKLAAFRAAYDEHRRIAA
jgi:hypothetical protein